jgi:hypothetical protein
LREIAADLMEEPVDLPGIEKPGEGDVKSKEDSLLALLNPGLLLDRDVEV